MNFIFQWLKAVWPPLPVQLREAVKPSVFIASPNLYFADVVDFDAARFEKSLEVRPKGEFRVQDNT